MPLKIRFAILPMLSCAMAIGGRALANNKGGWDLTEWKKVPPESVLQNQTNPIGEAVVCHSNTPDSNNIRIWCFVSANES
jgi:hypothetical protein